MSTLRNFFGWLERRDLVHNGAFRTIRSPKVPRTLPRPLSIKKARQVIEETGAIGGDPWLATRDAALYPIYHRKRDQQQKEEKDYGSVYNL